MLMQGPVHRRYVRLWLSLPLLSLLASCHVFPAVAKRDQKNEQLAAENERLRGEVARERELSETRLQLVESQKGALESARAAEAEGVEVRSELEAENERLRSELSTTEAARAGAQTDHARAKDALAEARARIAALEEELEASKGRERQLRRRVETLRVCCEVPDP